MTGAWRGQAQMTTVQRNLEEEAGGTKVGKSEALRFDTWLNTWKKLCIFESYKLKLFMLACTESQLTGMNLNTDWTGYDGCIKCKRIYI